MSDGMKISMMVYIHDLEVGPTYVKHLIVL
jgi:hypothetical protein